MNKNHLILDLEIFYAFLEIGLSAVKMYKMKKISFKKKILTVL